ncbi:MAG: hypothetical protein ACFB11_08020 [Paracoccaceae bacterium]
MPDHSSFSRYRHGRFQQSDMLRYIFEATVERCLREDFVSGEGFAVDVSLITADAKKFFPLRPRIERRCCSGSRQPRCQRIS